MSEKTTKTKVQDVKPGMQIRLYGEVFTVVEAGGEGYGMRWLNYQTTDRKGYGWRGRLMLHKGTKVRTVQA